MEHTKDTSCELLKAIVEQRGRAYLREGGGKFFVNAFAEMGGDKQDVTLLRYLTRCGGHEDLLDAGSLSPAMQRNYYSQTVRKLCEKTLISEELAYRVCGTFWRAVYQKDPPVTLQKPAPEPKPPVTQQKPIPEPKPPVSPRKPEAKPKQKMQEPVSESAAQPPVYRPMIHKRFYITKQEAQNGGPIRVYLPEGGYEVHTLPPNVREMQYVDPIAYNMKIGSGWDGKDDILRASDGRLAEATSKTHPVSSHPLSANNLEGLRVMLMLTIGLYCLSPVFQLLLIGLDWLLNCLGWDILQTSMPVFLKLPYCTLAFHSLFDVSVELGWPDTLRQWLSFVCVSVMPACPAVLFVLFWVEEWKNWLAVRREIARRRKL